MAEFILGSPLRNLAREHQSLRRWLWRADFALLWSLQKLLQALPVDASSRLGECLGRIIGPMMKSKTQLFAQNMAIAFPQLSEEQIKRRVKAAWGRGGRVLAEYPHLETILHDAERLQIDIRQSIPAYTERGRPAVIVTAHQSNWEVVCSAMAKLGMPNASLYSPPTNPLLDKLLLDSRRALNCELLPRDNSARALVQALKEGRTAAMVMDRRVDDGKPIPFFGHEKFSTIMPAKLAQKFDCELVPVQVERLRDAHFRVTFHPPIKPRKPQASTNEQAIDMITQVHAQFEQWIRAAPQDWFCSKRLWPRDTLAHTERPPAAAER